MIWYPTQSHYLDTELSNACTIPQIPNTRLGSDKYTWCKSVVWLRVVSNPRPFRPEASSLMDSASTSCQWIWRTGMFFLSDATRKYKYLCIWIKQVGANWKFGLSASLALAFSWRLRLDTVESIECKLLVEKVGSLNPSRIHAMTYTIENCRYLSWHTTLLG